MNISIKQSDKAKLIISEYNSQIEGKGRYYAHGKHDKFVRNYYEEAKEFAGCSESDTDLFLAEYEKYKVTGEENPVFFAKACEKTISALIELNNRGVSTPTEVSIGLVERHEHISMAFTKLEPPLIIYSSSLFDFAGDIIFLFLGPFMKAVFGLSKQYSLDSYDKQLLKDILLYQSLSMSSNLADDGKAYFGLIQYRDPPILCRPMPTGEYTEFFFRQLFESKNALYEFIALHESAHIRNKDIGDNYNKKEEEFICDGFAISVYLSNRIMFAKNNDELPQLTCAKLILPLLFIEIISYVEICIIAEKDQRPLESISHDSHSGDYPTFNERISAAENVLFETLSSFSEGSELTFLSHNLWSGVKKSLFKEWET